MKKLLFLSFFITYSLLLPRTVSAEYVLPYPSYMHGNRLYRITRIIDQLERFWYFGNIAQLTYHFKLADKYLVEAKTLMEYKQYLLAVDALGRSDTQFNKLPEFLRGAKDEGVDISILAQTVADAAVKHQEVLSGLSIPQQFEWKPEKALSTHLELGSMIQSSLAIRQSVASAAAGF